MGQAIPATRPTVVGERKQQSAQNTSRPSRPSKHATSQRISSAHLQKPFFAEEFAVGCPARTALLELRIPVLDPSRHQSRTEQSPVSRPHTGRPKCDPQGAASCDKDLGEFRVGRSTTVGADECHAVRSIRSPRLIAWNMSADEVGF